MRLCTVVLVTVLALFVSIQARGVEIRENGSLIELENNQYIAVFNVDHGARIQSLIMKADGVERVYWGKDGMHSGLLGDEGGGTQTYAVKIEEQSPQRVVIAFAKPESGPLSVVKRVTVLDNEPAIRVEYTYANKSNELLEVKQMVDNRFLAGGKAGEEDQYFWRGAEGVVSKPFPYSQVGAYHDPEGNWYGVIDTKTKTGLVMVVDSPFINCFYNWADNGPPNPTMAWILQLRLQPGEQCRVPVTLGLLRGLGGISDATANGVVYLKPQSKDTTLNLGIQFYALTNLAEGKSVNLFLHYETLDRIFIWEEDGEPLAPAPTEQVREGQSTLAVPAMGTYVVTVTTRLADQQLNHFEMPVVVGQSSGDYLHGKRASEKVRSLVELNDRDLAWGYVLHWGGGNAPFKPAQSAEIALGKDEYESVELDVLALRDLGSVSADVQSIPTIPDAAWQLQTEQGVAPDDNLKLPEGYAIVPGKSMVMPAYAHKSFWFTFNSRQLKPGDYALTIQITPENADPRQIQLVLHVIDVERAPSKYASLRMYFTLAYISKYGTSFEQHAKLLDEHYVHQMMFYPRFKQWDTLISVKRQSDGSLNIDFSQFDQLMKDALSYGFDELAIMSRYYNDNWLKGLSGESEDQLHKARIDVGGQMVDRLLKMGYKEVWNYCMDEPSVAEATSEDTLDRLKEIKGLHQQLKLHTTLNHYAPIVINKLNPLIDIWTPNYAICQTVLEDVQRGTVSIDPTDRLGFYRGSFYTGSPDAVRGDGWLAAMMGVSQYITFAYYQNRPGFPWQCFATDPDGNVVTTAVLEGLRDGFEEFGYWRRLDMLLAEAKKLNTQKLSRENREALEQAARFKTAVFGTDSKSMVPLKKMPGGHGSRSWQNIDDVDRWTFLKAKAALLYTITTVQKILNDNQ